MSVGNTPGALASLRARVVEVAGQVAQDEELARRLYGLAKTASQTSARADLTALVAGFARTPDELALLTPAMDEGGEDGTTTTLTILTTTTVTTGACTTTTLTTTTTTTQVVEA